MELVMTTEQVDKMLASRDYSPIFNALNDCNRQVVEAIKAAEQKKQDNKQDMEGEHA